MTPPRLIYGRATRRAFWRNGFGRLDKADLSGWKNSLQITHFQEARVPILPLHKWYAQKSGSLETWPLFSERAATMKYNGFRTLRAAFERLSHNAIRH
jgi:hypothetical protein